MLSMTGFGAGRAAGDAGEVTVQIAAVNHKGCRVHVRSELRDLGLEERIRGRVEGTLRRGSVNVHIAFRPATGLGLDPGALRAAWRELSAIAAELDAPAPSLADAARLTGGGGDADVEALGPLVEAACDEALAECTAMREREGAALREAFRGHHAALFELKAAIHQQAASRPAAHAERLRERLEAVLRDRAEVTPEHLVRELAIYSDRLDVTEELVRLDSHLEQLGGLITGDSPVGKKLEFLLQELGREINTTGAKANDAELQRLVVEAKGVLEQMKEQAANVL